MKTTIIGVCGCGLIVQLLYITIGFTFALVPILIMAFLICVAGYALLGKLQANEAALDTVITERGSTFKATVAAMRNGAAYTGNTVRLDESEVR